MASYKVYNLTTKTVRSLVEGDPALQNVQWNPVNTQVAYLSSSYSSFIIYFIIKLLYLIDILGTKVWWKGRYVNQNDIYIVDAANDLAPIQVTSDGDAEDGILNGVFIISFF